MRVWKDGLCLATVVTLRLPEPGGGEGWSRRGRGGSGEAPEAASAREAWWAAARWLRRALALAPRPTLPPPSPPPDHHLDWLKTRIRAWEEEERRSAPLSPPAPPTPSSPSPPPPTTPPSSPPRHDHLSPLTAQIRAWEKEERRAGRDLAIWSDWSDDDM